MLTPDDMDRNARRCEAIMAFCDDPTDAHRAAMEAACRAPQTAFPYAPPSRESCPGETPSPEAGGCVFFGAHGS